MASGEPPSGAAAFVPTAVRGPGAVAGGLLLDGAVRRADLDPRITARILKALGDVLPTSPLRAGAAGADRTLPPDSVAVLVPSAAVVAAGLDPAKVSGPAPAVLWTDGSDQLLVRVAEVTADLLDGAVVLTVPVTCDQTGPVDVTVSFITGTPDAPSGGVATTEDHPRGPAVVVERWAEPIIAFAWHTLVVATSSLSGAGGTDQSGRALVAADLAVTANGLTVTPQARHTFLTGGTP